jgi:hypothetical protein
MKKAHKLSDSLPETLPNTPEKVKWAHKNVEGVIWKQVGLVDDIIADNKAWITSDETIIWKIISWCEILELHEEETLPNWKKVRKASVRKKKWVTLYRYITEDNKIYEVEWEEIVAIFKNKSDKKLLLNWEEIELKKCLVKSWDRCITKDDLFFRIEWCIVRRIRYDDKWNITHVNVLENDKDKTYELKNWKIKRTKIEKIKKFFKKFRKIK